MGAAASFHVKDDHIVFQHRSLGSAAGQLGADEAVEQERAAVVLKDAFEGAERNSGSFGAPIFAAGAIVLAIAAEPPMRLVVAGGRSSDLAELVCAVARGTLARSDKSHLTDTQRSVSTIR